MHEESSRPAGRLGMRIPCRLPVPRAASLLILCFVMSPAAAAQEDTSVAVPAVLAKLEGQWVGSGVLLGQPAEFVMRWKTAEEGFVRLFFSNARVTEDETRTPVLSAEATYLPSGSSALGVWLDNRPQRLTLHAALTDSTLTTSWMADTEEGRTEYLVRSRDEVIVRDIVYVNGSERQFAYATYHRDPISSR